MLNSLRVVALVALSTALLSALLLGGCAEDRRVRLATTTSTRDSGLMERLRPNFEQAHGIALEIIAVGTGQALELGRRGDVDVVLVHARDLEDEFVAGGYGIDRRDIMWNDFLIVGPVADPAAVQGSPNAAAAFERIASSGSNFVSRGDGSGTHLKEQGLWRAVAATKAGSDYPPRNGSNYIESGQGQGKSLLIASQKQAYILTDRGTWLRFRDRTELEVLHEGDPLLRNPYGAILVNPERHPHVRHDEARALLDYLVSAEAQAMIGDYRLEGEPLFHPATEDG